MLVRPAGWLAISLGLATPAQAENCRLALQNMRYDLVRLRTGSATLDQVTLVAERAMALARDVDGALEAAEIARGAAPSREIASQATRNRR